MLGDCMMTYCWAHSTWTGVPTCACRDWGMGMAASGIYGGVKLLAFDTAVLTGVHVQQHKQGDEFILDIESELMVPPRGDAGTIWIALPELGITEKVRVTMDGTLQQVGVSLAPAWNDMYAPPTNMIYM